MLTYFRETLGDLLLEALSGCCRSSHEEIPRWHHHSRASEPWVAFTAYSSAGLGHGLASSYSIHSLKLCLIDDQHLLHLSDYDLAADLCFDLISGQLTDYASLALASDLSGNSMSSGSRF